MVDDFKKLWFNNKNNHCRVFDDSSPFFSRTSSSSQGGWIQHHKPIDEEVEEDRDEVEEDKDRHDAVSFSQKN